MSRRGRLKIVAIDGDLVNGDLVAGTEAPAVDPAVRTAANDPAPATPGWAPQAEDAPDRRPAAPSPAPHRWRTLPTLALSLAVHAALIATAAAVLTRAGTEAETDPVAVEIVFEAPPSVPAEPAPAETAEAAVAEDETPAAAEPTVQSAEIVPPPDAVTQALLAEPPVVEPAAPVKPGEPESAMAPAAVEPVEPQTIEIPAPDPALAVLSVPPTLAEAPTIAPAPVPAKTADAAPLPDAVAAMPTPRPHADAPPAAKTRTAAAPPREAKKPEPRKAAAPKENARTADAPEKAERTAEAKPAPAAKKPAAKPAAKKPAQAGAGAAASAGANAGAEAAYGRKLLSHVERRKRYPAAAKAAGIAGAVRLSVTIDRAGQLKSARVSKGSGHSVLDEEALATARRASPYPAPPDGVGGKTFAFSVTLRFSR